MAPLRRTDIVFRGMVIGPRAEVRTSRWHQARGLMFSRPQNLILDLAEEKRPVMHMFFVFFSIDVIFADARKEIVEIKARFRPFSVYFPRKKAKFILELAAGTADEYGLRPGDRLSFDSPVP